MRKNNQPKPPEYAAKIAAYNAAIAPIRESTTRFIKRFTATMNFFTRSERNKYSNDDIMNTTTVLTDRDRVDYPEFFFRCLYVR